MRLVSSNAWVLATRKRERHLGCIPLTGSSPCRGTCRWVITWAISWGITWVRSWVTSNLLTWPNSQVASRDLEMKGSPMLRPKKRRVGALFFSHDSAQQLQTQGHDAGPRVLAARTSALFGILSISLGDRFKATHQIDQRLTGTSREL